MCIRDRYGTVENKTPDTSEVTNNHNVTTHNETVYIQQDSLLQQIK